MSLEVPEFTPVPNLDGITSGMFAWRFAHEGTNLTDRMGLMGICMVFPEFAPAGSDMQRLITYAHCIDHVQDNGPDFRRTRTGKTNGELLEIAESDFALRYTQRAWSPSAHANSLGFIAQANTVEKSTPLKTHNPVAYRELVNTIWVRMAVSFGAQLIDPDSQGDVAGTRNADLSHEELEQAYRDYRSGKELTNVPGGTRNYQLFMWTMAVQQQFDKHTRQANTNADLPSLPAYAPSYYERARQAGVRPSVLAGAALAIKSLLVTKSALIYTLPKYSEERRLKLGHRK